MLENLYTTKMSANKKTLQNRFTKIRRESGRISKIMAAVMSCAVAITMLGATIVMAAVGSDGLEHWDKNEVYFLSGMTFSINIADNPVPDWVRELAGEKGIINVSLSKYAFRDTYGDIRNSVLGRFSSDNNVLTLIHNTSSWDYGKTTYKMYFGGSSEGLTNDFNVQPDDGKHIRVSFSLDDTGLMINPEVEFFMLAPAMGFNESEKADTVFKPENVDLIGDFNHMYLNDVNCVSDSSIFLDYEINDYKNRNISGIDIDVISADNNKIIINADSQRNEIKDIRAYVYNSDSKLLSSLHGLVYDENGYKAKIYNNNVEAAVTADGKMITLYAPKAAENKKSGVGFYSNEEYYGRFISGNTYRVELGMYGENNNLLYRWQEYITIK